MFITEVEKVEVNLNNPIFVHYINIDGLVTRKVRELFDNAHSSLGNYKNITFWFVPITDGQSRIECVYNGLYNINKIKKVISIIDDLCEKYPEHNLYSELKTRIRELIIDELV